MNGKGAEWRKFTKENYYNLTDYEKNSEFIMKPDWIQANDVDGANIDEISTSPDRKFVAYAVMQNGSDW